MVAIPPRQPQFNQVRRELADFDGAALAASSGALQLVPGNNSRLWRLRALTALSFSVIPDNGKPAPSRSQLRQLLNAGDLAAGGARQDDPPEDVIAEEVAFFGGSYLVASGSAEEAVYVLRLLLRSPQIAEALPSEVRKRLDAVTWGTLRLSDHVLRKAGLRRFQAPEEGDGRIVVPGASRMRELEQLLTFDAKRLAAVCGLVDLQVLQPLILEAGSRHFSDAELFDGDADAWPLYKADDRYVVSSPLNLAVALRHHLLLTASDAIGADAVAEAFHLAVVADVRRSFTRMGIQTEATPSALGPCCSEVRAQVDSDVELVAAVMTDSLQGYGPGTLYGLWPAGAVNAAAQVRLEHVADAHSDSSILGLLIGQSAGRGTPLGVRAVKAANAIVQLMSAVDLDVLSYVETGDPLALWKFARACDALRGHARVRAWSPLDLYAIYRDDERSLTPMREADHISVQSGSAFQIRTRAKQQRDRHGVPYIDGSVREVETDGPPETSDGEYHPYDLIEPRYLRPVIGLPLAVWVQGPTEHVRATAALVESVAYWVGQLAEPLAGYWTLLREQAQSVQLEVAVEDPEAWVRQEPADGTFSASIVADTTRVRITFAPGLLALVRQIDNVADREIVQTIIAAVNAIGAELSIAAVGDAAAAAAVDTVAPLGLKKHLLSFPADANVMMEHVEGDARLVKQADLTAAREALAEHLRGRFGVREGFVPREQRKDLVKSAVAFLGDACQAVIDRVSPEGLLEALLFDNERITAEAERARVIRPMRELTYPAAADHQRLREDTASYNQAALCCRFLAEYAAAQPPAGAGNWSMARYDEALALCAEMLDWAYLSDAYQYGLTDVDLLIRDDGQLRLVELDEYEHGRSAYFDRYLLGQRRRARSMLPMRLAPEDPEPSEVFRRLEKPMRAEAGASIDEIRDMLHAAIDEARSRNQDVMVLEEHDVLRVLSEATDRSAHELKRPLDYLTMGPRATFFAPPTGGWQDVVPWRFARRWSLNRRPFVSRIENGQRQVLWGRRQLQAALLVTVGLLTSGRFQGLAESDDLREELGRLADEAGHEFEAEVLALFEQLPDLNAAGRITNLDGQPLRRKNGDTLGDIDVMAADSQARSLWAVECKDLVGALTPSDAMDELERHFGDASGSSAAKHAERVAWLAARIPAALDKLGIVGSPAGWKVRGLFVVSQPVMAPYVRKLPMPICPASDIEDFVAEQRSKARQAKKRKRRR